MAIIGSTYSSNASSKPIGTLQSNDLFYQPPVPGKSQQAGIQGTDGRAYTRNVARNELAGTHLNTMLDANDPYMQNARQRGLEAAARRGLMNSSIAAGNSQRAAIEAATPIAMQQAGAYGQAATENLGFLNQNLMQERDIANQVLTEKYRSDQMGQAGEAAREAARLEAENRYRMFAENLAYEGEQRGLDRAHDFGISDMGYRQDLGRMGAEYGYDLGRQNNQNQWTSRENDRGYQREIGLQNNQYSNQRYNNTQQALLDSNINRGDAAFAFMLQTFRDDPSTSPQDMDGFYQWATNIANQDIDGLIDFYMGGG
jgi:hypothetical protein